MVLCCRFCFEKLIILLVDICHKIMYTVVQNGVVGVHYRKILMEVLR
jgi:hypothetical protein